MKIKELIAKLNKYNPESEVIIRFGLSQDDELGYGLEPIHVYDRLTDVCICGEYTTTKEDCDFVGQIDLIEARNYYLNEGKDKDKLIEAMAYELSEEDENFQYRHTKDIIEWFKQKVVKEN